MIQEYLFSDKKQRTSVKKYKPQNVYIEFSDIKDSECWIASYSTERNDERAANLLSKVNDFVLKNFQPIVLTNESAAYFNRSLYPTINEFERKLRKLLYLKSALNKGEKASENIKDLESKDLGNIFELLFTDEQFVKNVRRTVNEKTWQFTKYEIIETIKDWPEETLWKDLIGEQSVPTLQREYLSAKRYRNDAMHAHNISYEEYKAAKKLIKEINNQLDTEIGRILSIAERQTESDEVRDYNAALSDALLNMKRSYEMSDYVQQMAAIRENISSSMLPFQEMVSSIPKFPPEYYSEISRFVDEMRVLQSYIDTSELAKTLSDLSRLIQSYQDSLNERHKPLAGSDETKTDADDGAKDKSKSGDGEVDKTDALSGDWVR